MWLKLKLTILYSKIIFSNSKKRANWDHLDSSKYKNKESVNAQHENNGKANYEVLAS